MKKKIQIEPMVLIGKIDNGWIVQYQTDYGLCQEAVVLNDNTQPGDKDWAEKLRTLLYLVREGLCEYYSKHHEYEVSIDVYKDGKIVELDVIKMYKNGGIK